MNRRVFLSVSFLLALGCGTAEPPIEAKDIPDAIVVYSLDFIAFEADKVANDAETFHGYPFLGKLEVSNAKEKNDIATAFRDQMDRKGLSPATCFWPRHGIRYTKNNSTDYLICFQCQQYRKWIGKDPIEHGLIGPEPEKIIDEILTAANVKLSPKPKGHV